MHATIKYLRRKGSPYTAYFTFLFIITNHNKGLFRKYARLVLWIFGFPIPLYPCTLLYVFKVTPPLRVILPIHHTLQLKNFILLLFSIVSKFAEFDTYSRTLKIITCLYRNINENAILRLQSLRGSFIYIRCFTSNYRVKIT